MGNAKGTLNLHLNEDAQIELSFYVEEPGGSNARGSSTVTRAHTLDMAKAIIAARPDVDWAGFLAELARKREAR